MPRRVEVQEAEKEMGDGIYRRLLDLAVNAIRQRAVSTGVAVILVFTALGIAGCGAETSTREPGPPIVATPTPEILQEGEMILPGEAFVVTGIPYMGVRIGDINFRSSPEVIPDGSNIVDIPVQSGGDTAIEFDGPFIVVRGKPTNLVRRYDYWVVIPIQGPRGVQIVYAAISRETVHVWLGVPKDVREGIRGVREWLEDQNKLKPIGLEPRIKVTVRDDGTRQIQTGGWNVGVREHFYPAAGEAVPTPTSTTTQEQHPRIEAERRDLMIELLRYESQLLETAIKTPLPEPADLNNPESVKRHKESLKAKFEAEDKVIEWLETQVVNNPDLTGEEKAKLVQNAFLGVFLSENRLRLFDLMMDLKENYPDLELFRQVNKTEYRNWLKDEGHNIHEETLAIALRAYEWMIDFIKSEQSESFLDFIYEDVPKEDREVLKAFVRKHPELFVPSPGALATLMAFETGTRFGYDANGNIVAYGENEIEHPILAMVNIGTTPLENGLKGSIREETIGYTGGALNPNTPKEQRLLYLLHLSAQGYGLSLPDNTFTNLTVPGSAAASEDASGGAIGIMVLPNNMRLLMRAWINHIQPYTGEVLPSPFDPFDGSKYVLMFLMNIRGNYYQSAYTAIPPQVIEDMRQWVAEGKMSEELEKWFDVYEVKEEDRLALARALSLSFEWRKGDNVYSYPAFDRWRSIFKWNPHDRQIRTIINGDNLWWENVIQQKQQGFNQNLQMRKVPAGKHQHPGERKWLKEQQRRYDVRIPERSRRV